MLGVETGRFSPRRIFRAVNFLPKVFARYALREPPSKGSSDFPQEAVRAGFESLRERTLGYRQKLPALLRNLLKNNESGT